jgi:hypothetical protein
MSFIAYFLSISISLLLVYNFLTTVLFCFQKELLTENKRIRMFQQFLLGIILILMFAYVLNTKNISAELYVIPWIWGFLASHLFIIRKKRWLNELLGLGVLLAISIVIFFKQSEIIHFFTKQEPQPVVYEVYLGYLSLGVFLGAIFWPRVRK